MKISIRQAGGFAGIPIELGTVDTSQLDRAITDRLHALFDNAASAEQPVGADLPVYEVTATDNGSVRTATLVDDGTPQTAPVRELVQAVMQAPR